MKTRRNARWRLKFKSVSRPSSNHSKYRCKCSKMSWTFHVCVPTMRKKNCVSWKRRYVWVERISCRRWTARQLSKRNRQNHRRSHPHRRRCQWIFQFSRRHRGHGQTLTHFSTLSEKHSSAYIRRALSREREEQQVGMEFHCDCTHICWRELKILFLEFLSLCCACQNFFSLFFAFKVFNGASACRMFVIIRCADLFACSFSLHYHTLSLPR